MVGFLTSNNSSSITKNGYPVMKHGWTLLHWWISQLGRHFQRWHFFPNSSPWTIGHRYQTTIHHDISWYIYHLRVISIFPQNLVPIINVEKSYRCLEVHLPHIRCFLPQCLSPKKHFTTSGTSGSKSLFEFVCQSLMFRYCRDCSWLSTQKRRSTKQQTMGDIW